MPPLNEWENFYVIIGSSAGALTGLMFVVITLGAEARRLKEDSLQAFATPTIVHFCAVLLLAALISTPRQTVATLRACILVTALSGILWALRAMVMARRQSGYTPVFSDWVWHGILPVVAYASLLGAGLMLGGSPEAALDVVGGSALLLLFVGIRNAWDAAVWLAMQRQGALEATAPPGEPSE